MRIFIGIGLPDSVKNHLMAIQDKLREKGIKGSWKSDNQFHLTVVFLGEVKPEILPDIKAVLSNVTGKVPELSLQTENIGGFPNLRKPHTIWIGLSGDIELLTTLKNRLDKELHKFGFKPERRTYKPHLTICSRPKFQNLNLSTVEVEDKLLFKVTELFLFQSQQKDGKIVYEVLHRVSLDS